MTASAACPDLQLQLDVGNTRLKWRLLSLPAAAGAEPVTALTVLGSGFLVLSDFPQAADGLAVLRRELQPVLNGNRVTSLRVATVAARALSVAIEQWARENWGITARFACVTAVAAGVTAGYDNPAMLGVDRWLAVLAASRYGGDDFVIVDCGSAVTVDLLSKGQHSGGYIVPGLRLMNRALFGDTALVKVQPRWSGQVQVEPGRNTTDAVSGGLPLMVAGLVQEVLRRQQARTGTPWKVLLCGGDAHYLSALLPAEVEFRVVEDLVLDGLMWAEMKPLDLAGEA